jgi:hypothetical protein
MARVALYGAGGSPYNHAAILAQAGHDVAFVFPPDVAESALTGFDVFVMPGGGYRSMVGQLEPLGPEGCRAVHRFVEAGGMYIGSCAGAYDAATVPNRFVASCPAQKELRLLDARVWNDAEDADELQSPGIGELVCETVAPDHPVMAGVSSRFTITHYNGPLFDERYALSRIVDRGEAFTAAEDFLGPSGGRHLVDDAIKDGAANIVAGPCGRGRVVLFGSHPEFGATLAMDDVTPAARLLTNAVEWQSDEAGPTARAATPVRSEAPVAERVAADDLDAVRTLAASIAERCERLQDRTDDAPWLAEGAAMSMFGRSARDIWLAALASTPKLAAEAADNCPALPAHLRSFRAPEDWPVDGGFHGVVPLLQQADGMLAAAETQWRDDWPGRITDPYSYDMESPYHLVAGSYLAAVGRTASAALLTRGRH